jgi:hypothetical protein
MWRIALSQKFSCVHRSPHASTNTYTQTQPQTRTRTRTRTRTQTRTQTQTPTPTPTPDTDTQKQTPTRKQTQTPTANTDRNNRQQTQTDTHAVCSTRVREVHRQICPHGLRQGVLASAAPWQTATLRQPLKELLPSRGGKGKPVTEWGGLGDPRPCEVDVGGCKGHRWVHGGPPPLG